MTLAELKALTEAATPGPWRTGRRYDETSVYAENTSSIASCFGHSVSDAPNAACIAAANPRIVLAMIEFVRQFDRWETHDNKWSSAPGLFFDVEQARAALDAVLKETGDGNG